MILPNFVYRAINVTGRGVLIFLFLYAGIVKQSDYVAFELSIRSFHVFPEIITPWLARTMPCLEVLAALCLFSQPTIKAGAFLIAAMSAGFTLIYIFTLFTGVAPDCGCFGKNAILNVPPVMGAIRAGCLTLLAFSLFLSPTPSNHSPWSSSH